MNLLSDPDLVRQASVPLCLLKCSPAFVPAVSRSSVSSCVLQRHLLLQGHIERGVFLRRICLQGSYSQIAEAVNYAADKGVKVVNLSLGGPP